jgi:hypothetical protein
MSEDRNRNPVLGATDPNRGLGTADCAPPPDVSLLLRAHSEQYLLSRDVIPVVRQLETGERLPDEQLPAAAAYLEVIWAEAAARAHETDAALRQLEQLDLARQPFSARARRYHAAVRSLREAVARRVAPLIAAPAEAVADWQGRLPDLIP